MGRPPRILNSDLLAIAREAFIKAGQAGSTKEIAKRAGISEAALFGRFPTKAALFLAAMEPPFADVEAMRDRANACGSAREGLQSLARDSLAYFREALPVILPLVTHPSIGLDEVLHHMGKGPALEIGEVIEGYFAAQTLNGAMAAPDPRAAAMLLVSAVHSAVLFEMMGVHGGKVPEAQFARMIDALWFGLALPPKEGNLA